MAKRRRQIGGQQAKPFTYIDPVDGQTKTVTLPPGQIQKLKQQLRQTARRINQERRAAANPFGAGAVVSPSSPGYPAGGQPTAYPPTYPPLAVGAPVSQGTSAIVPNVPPNCTPFCLPSVGWMSTILAVMASQSRFAMSLDPENSIFVGPTDPLMLSYPSVSQLLLACQLAVQGDATKVDNMALWPAQGVPTNLTVAAGLARVFGIRVRVSNSVLNFKFGTYRIQMVSAASGVPVVQSTVNVVVRKLPIDIIILSISNAAGIATVVPNEDPGVRLLAADNPALVPTSDVIYVEGLNQRDLGFASPLQNTQVVSQFRDTYDANSEPIEV